MVLDSSANEALMSKTFNEAVEILDRIAKNNSEWIVDDLMSHQLTIHQKMTCVIENDQISALKAQKQAVQMMLKNLAFTSQGNPPQHATKIPPQGAQQLFQVSQAESTTTYFCNACGDFHSFDYCPQNPESVCFVGQPQQSNRSNQNNSYSNT